jgi:hypothetical protein
MKLPSKNEVDSGKLGARGTCVYAEPDGRQVKNQQFLNNPKILASQSNE